MTVSLEPEGGNLQICHQAWIRLLTQNSWVLTEGYLIVWFQRIEVAFLAETPSTTTSCSLSGEL